jgi:hypothetical protein
MFKWMVVSGIAILVTGCTYSMTMINTDGTASDVVDQNQTPTTSVSPTISVPASVLP